MSCFAFLFTAFLLLCHDLSCLLSPYTLLPSFLLSTPSPSPLHFSISPEASMTPGIWMAPFACDKHSDLAKNHPDWILTRKRTILVRNIVNSFQGIQHYLWLHICTYSISLPIYCNEIKWAFDIMG